MAGFLLDTCTFLWIDIDDPSLSARCRSLFQDPLNEIYLSGASVWEMVLKYQLGKLSLPQPPERFIPAVRGKYRIDFLPIDEPSALSILRLPRLHKDPFDRMIVSQAVVHGLTILTPDNDIRRYPVLTDW